ncbi:interferon gamma receptor 2 isoform X2 [Dipodomys spectabilis]|uniref:interferon gamma receptor 2 isoform X2 n=1 Tax=Dipodomys spectabilis TaxID=105255 RepID=UPI001C536D0C|nr:interferon gamma receptor 2 isoform X2 [Dipodomys spectabilis]
MAAAASRGAVRPTPSWGGAAPTAPATRTPPPWRWLLLLLLLLLLRLSCPSTATPPPDSFSQLAAPQYPKIHLYNEEQVLSWEWSSANNDTRPVVYRVQYKYITSEHWHDVTVNSVGVNCTRIPETQCNFTNARFLRCSSVSLHVRAELGEIVSAWTTGLWFQYYQNVTIGPPKDMLVTPEAASLLIRLSSPFELPRKCGIVFVYYIHYWEEAGVQQVKGPMTCSTILLDNLKPLKVYCLQAEARLSLQTSRPGRLSNISCYETMAKASSKVQQVALISVATFLVLLALSAHFLFRYKSQVKYWFHTPPRIPSQIEEYLKDPVLPILEALDKDSSPEDTWDSVSVISFPAKEDVLQTLESER